MDKHTLTLTSIQYMFVHGSLGLNVVKFKAWNMILSYISLVQYRHLDIVGSLGITIYTMYTLELEQICKCMLTIHKLR